MLEVKKARPTFNGVFVTYDRFERDQFDKNGLLVFSQGTIKPWQRVVAVGPFVKTVKEGDLVKVSLGRYAVHKYEENSIKRDIMEDKIIDYRPPFEYIDGVKYMHIQDNDIMVIYDEAEEVEYDKNPASDIVIVKDEIITA
jgi:hypothetical protein